MAGGGQPIQIGPFIGGLNTYSDDSAVDDRELVVCDNFEPDIDGSLKSRPPIVDSGVSLSLKSVGDIHLLGYFNSTSNAQYLIGSNGSDSTYYFNGTSWVLITASFAATAFVQFDNKAWLLSPVGYANPGGYWTPSGGFTAQPNMPRGEVIVAHKLRLWVAVGQDATVNGTRLYNSAVLGTASLWPAAPDFTDVGGGDGQNIVQIVVYYDSLLIFRTSSIYAFNFAGDPAQGAVRLVVPNIGLTDPYALAQFESLIFFQYDDKAYQFQNNRASQINQKVPFVSGSQIGIYLPYAVSVFNRRIIFSYWDKTYVYYVQTQTWVTWSSTKWGPLGAFISMPADSGPTRVITHSSKSSTTRKTNVLIVTDAVTAGSEPFICTVQTKNYNYEASSIYKRLFSGGIDGIFRGKITASAVPIIYIKNLTWGQLRANGTTWGDLLGKTWGTLSSDSLIVTTVVPADTANSQRKFVKLWKSLYFRQIYYRCVFETDGSLSTAPVRLFSLMTYALAKEPVSRGTT